MRISDWSSDVCSSDLTTDLPLLSFTEFDEPIVEAATAPIERVEPGLYRLELTALKGTRNGSRDMERDSRGGVRSEEHTSELQSLMRISYAVFCLQKKKQVKVNNTKLVMSYKC